LDCFQVILLDGFKELNYKVNDIFLYKRKKPVAQSLLN
jgi:hypothetical protein